MEPILPAIHQLIEGLNIVKSIRMHPDAFRKYFVIGEGSLDLESFLDLMKEVEKTGGCSQLNYAKNVIFLLSKTIKYLSFVSPTNLKWPQISGDTL